MRVSSILSSCFTFILAGHASAVLIFSDNLSEANNTQLSGKLPDIGQAWTQPVGPLLTIQGNTVSTAGAAREAFAFFSRPLAANEVLTITADTRTINNFFSTGFAGYSLFTGGTERALFGDVADSTFWAIRNVGTATSIVSANNTLPNIATFTYNAFTGAASLALSSGGTVASTTLPTGLAVDRLRIANNNGGDVVFGTITADATVVPEPASALLLGFGALGLLARRRRD